jgi:hypothetical protein
MHRHVTAQHKALTTEDTGDHRGKISGPLCPRWCSVYFEVGAVLSVLGCLAMIRSLTLS